MHNKTLTTLLIAAATIGLAGISQAQTPAPATPAPAPAPAATPAPAAPLFATTKVEGTDNVYVFRYQNHQAMFVVTPAGVIATDPISYGRPQAAKSRAASRSRMLAPKSSRTSAPRNGWPCSRLPTS
jgi:hypothetical protein